HERKMFAKKKRKNRKVKLSFIQQSVSILNAFLTVLFLITFHLWVAFCLLLSLEPVEESLLEKYGFPEAGTETRCYTNHALSYDQAKRVPRWVIEHISKQKTLGTMGRKDVCPFVR
uniref:DNA/RNA non-specific endonuclease/pyrophosphatase/phosphodiesterase domain-containing protein n=1 Tax=Accipiter nisus TaxID=211598 RepID=A0A8B9S1V5_9AVES